MWRKIGHILTVAICIAGLAGSVRAQGQPAQPAASAITRLGPTDKLIDAPQGTPLLVQSKVTGIDGLANERGDPIEYVITLPKGLNTSRAWDVVLVLSDTDVPASWQSKSLPAETFGSDVIVVGMGPVRMSAEGMMVYQPGGRDSVIARDLILEITRQVPAGRVFLLGHGAGGSYALATAASFPRLIAGVVCIDSGLWRGTPMPPLSRMAIGLVDQRGGHGRPGTWSLDALGVLQEAEHAASQVFWSKSDAHSTVDARTVAQATLFVRGMASSEPSDVLNIARRLLASDASADASANASAPGPAFGAARLMLARFEPFVPREGMSDEEMQRAKINRYPSEVKDPTDAERREAAALRDAIEAHGLRHAARLRELAARGAAPATAEVSSLRPSLKYDVDAPVATWLGHVLSVQHRMAGVESLRGYLSEVDLASWQLSQAPQAEGINALARVKQAMESQDPAPGIVDANLSAGEAITTLIAQWLDGGAVSADAPTDLSALLTTLSQQEPTLKEAPGWSEMLGRAKARDLAMEQGRVSAAEVDRQFVLPVK